MKFPVKKHNEGHFIFKEGATGDAAYIVKTGSVEIFRVMKDKRITLSVINEGGILGEMALFMEENKRTASAIAKTYTELVEISKSELNDIIKSCPTIISAVLQSLVIKLKETTFSVTTRTVEKPFISICTVLSLLFEKMKGTVTAEDARKTLKEALSISEQEINFLLKKAVSLHLFEKAGGNFVCKNSANLPSEAKKAYNEFKHDLSLSSIGQETLFVDLADLGMESSVPEAKLRERLARLPDEAIGVKRYYIGEMTD